MQNELFLWWLRWEPWFFPLLMYPVLYYRNMITTIMDASREERLVPQLILLVLYVITFVYFARLPLSRMIQGYVLSATILLFLVFLVTLKFKICGHMAALGGMTGLIITLILMYETNLQAILIIVLMASGLMGSSRLFIRAQRPIEVYAGYMLGFVVVLTTLLVF